MRDIIKRLQIEFGGQSTDDYNLHCEAAIWIAHYRFEIERLRAENEQLLETASLKQSCWKDQQEIMRINNELRAELAQREAEVTKRDAEIEHLRCVLTKEKEAL